MRNIELGRPNPKLMEDAFQWQEMQKTKNKSTSSFGDSVGGAIVGCVLLLILGAALNSVNTMPVALPTVSTNALP